MKLEKGLGKKVNFFGLRPSKFSKFSPAALKIKIFGASAPQKIALKCTDCSLETRNY